MINPIYLDQIYKTEIYQESGKRLIQETSIEPDGSATIRYIVAIDQPGFKTTRSFPDCKIAIQFFNNPFI